MASTDTPLDRLWDEYGEVFRGFDDLSLARWMAQTLGQFEGRVWRLSHPLLGAYRLAAQAAHNRQIWLQRLATAPPAYVESACCRAPLLPLFTRDILESGLCCQHCGGTAMPFEELSTDLQAIIRPWADEYSPVHAVAHREEPQRKRKDFEQDLEQAAVRAERLLVRAGRAIVPRLLEYFPSVVWEDQDECLEVRPEDLQL